MQRLNELRGEREELVLGAASEGWAAGGAAEEALTAHSLPSSRAGAAAPPGRWAEFLLAEDDTRQRAGDAGCDADGDVECVTALPEAVPAMARAGKRARRGGGGGDGGAIGGSGSGSGGGRCAIGGGGGGGGRGAVGAGGGERSEGDGDNGGHGCGGASCAERGVGGDGGKASWVDAGTAARRGEPLSARDLPEAVRSKPAGGAPLVAGADAAAAPLRQVGASCWASRDA